MTRPDLRTRAVHVRRASRRTGRRKLIFISVLATLTLCSPAPVTADAPMAESSIAARKPPWTRPAGLRNRSSTRMVHTVVPGTDLSTQTRPSVRSQLGGICRATSEGYPATSQMIGYVFTTLGA